MIGVVLASTSLVGVCVGGFLLDTGGLSFFYHNMQKSVSKETAKLAEKLNLKEEFLCITQGQSTEKGRHTDTLCSITTDWDTSNGDTMTVTDTVVDDTTDGN
jgi:hypothetical protein